MIHQNLNGFFEELLADLDCHPMTKSYILSIYDKYKVADGDLSKYSITLLFAQARSKNDFSIYQNIGDWVFFSNTWAPNHLKNASKDYYDTVAKLSYYSCYKITNRQWKLFEELSDNFNIFEEKIKSKLNLFKI